MLLNVTYLVFIYYYILFYSQSGYACMAFYRRDSQVVEIQESGMYKTKVSYKLTI